MSEAREPVARRIRRLQQENRELSRELESLRQFMSSLEAVLAAAGAPRGEEQAFRLLEHVLDSALRTIDATDGSLLVPDNDTGELVFALVRGDAPKDDLLGVRLPQGKGVASWVVENRRAAIVNNAASDDRFYRDVDARLEFRTQSLLAAPLIGGGQVLGVVEVLNKRDGKLFSTANQTLLTVMCRFAGELLFGVLREFDLSDTAARMQRLSA